MNIYVEIFAILLELLVIIFYLINRKNIIKFNIPILLINICILFSIVFDLCSIYLIKYQGLNWNSYVISYLYLINLILVTYLFAIYIISQITFKEKDSKKFLNFGVTITTIVYIIAIILLPIDVIYKGINDEPYLLGPAVNAAYIGSTLILLFDLGLIIAKSANINARVKKGIVIYIIICYIATFLQILIDFIIKPNDVIYFIGIAEAIGSLVIYSLLDNPSVNIDSVSGTMNRNSFNAYVSKMLDHKNDNTLSIFMFEKNNMITFDQINDISFKLGDILKNFEGKVFKFSDSVFMLLRNNDHNDSLITDFKNLHDKFISKYPEYQNLNYKIFTLSSLFMFKSKDELINSIPFIINDRIQFNNKITYVDNKRIEYIQFRIRISKLVDYSIKHDSIKIEYQPIYNQKEKRFTSAEALLRLVDESGNIIYPHAFIDMVESDGRIISLGNLVFKHVCEFISKNNLESLGLRYIEVNLSPTQCAKLDFENDLIEIVKKYNINPHIINIEITENAAAKQKDLIFAMEHLRDFGFSFSLDDFGTGNSNLNYVTNMPVDIVKFDKNMVDSYFLSQKGRKIVTHAMNMIKDLGQEIVFEGVENEYQKKAIEKLPVDYIQGFYFSRPLDEDSFKNLLIKHDK